MSIKKRQQHSHDQFGTVPGDDNHRVVPPDTKKFLNTKKHTVVQLNYSCTTQHNMSWGGNQDNNPPGNPFATNQDNTLPEHSAIRRDESVAYGMTIDELQQNIRHNLTLIQSSISLSVGMINMLGKPNTDSNTLRSRIRDVLRGIASKIKKTGDYLKQMSVSDLKKKRSGSEPRSAGVAVRKKLEKDLASLKQTLNELTNRCELKIRQYPLSEEAPNEGNPFESPLSNNKSDNSGGGGGPGTYGGNCATSSSATSVVSGVNGLVGAEGSYVSREQVHARLQQQMLIEGETEVNEVMINERNDAMRKINRDLHEVREIFSDLATMIEDQDEGLEVIGENVQKSAMAAEKGRKELEKANELQKKSTCTVS